jgi:hypothetical protein
VVDWGEISLEPGSYITDLNRIDMNTGSDFNYFVSELESLGIRTARLNEPNDVYELENLVDYIKQMYIQEYRSYSSMA